MQNKKIFFLIFIFCFALPLAWERVGIGFSQGEQYYRRLQKWYAFAAAGDWKSAAALESKLDPIDLENYKKTHEPGELKKYINSLVLKNNKSTEDWLELARIQSILGKSNESVDSLTHARDMDPIRDDISKLYYQVAK